MSAPVRASQFTVSAGRFEVNAANPMAGLLVQDVILTIFTVLSVVQLIRQRAWFFCAFPSALALQATGCIAQAYLTQDETNHVLYLVTFACLTLAPALLALSTISAYRRLHSSTVLYPRTAGYRTLWMPERVSAAFCTAIQTSAVTFFLFGIAALAALHNPMPIAGREGALARLTYEAQALAFLRIGWMIQFFGLAVFMVVASGSSVMEYLDSQNRSVYWAINWVALLNLARSFWKLLDFVHLEPESLDLASSGMGEWAIDILPLLVAFTLFIRYNPGQVKAVSLNDLSRGAGDRKQVYLPYESLSSC